MASTLFTMRLLPEEEHLLAAASKLTGRSQSDLVRSILVPALEKLIADNSVAYVSGEEFVQIWKDLSQGKTSDDVAFQKQLFEEEEKFWAK